MTVRNATRAMFERYAAICAKRTDFGSHSRVPETSYAHLRGMCAHALENVENWPIDKLSRWLGFVQGILIFHGVMRVDGERDFSRPLFHAAYAEEGIEIPKTQDALPIRE